MFAITQRWPFGLGRTVWLRLAATAVLALALISLVDPFTSRFVVDAAAPARPFFEWLTRFGESDWILIPALALFALSALPALVMPRGSLPRRALWENAQIFGFIFVAIALPGLVATLFKRLIGRARPHVYDEGGQFSFQPVLNDYFYQAFPSGHATTSLGLAFVVGFLAPRWFPVALVLGIAIAASRVVVEAHSLSDILAGMIVGTFGAYLIRNVFADRGWVFVAEGDRVSVRPPTAIKALFAGQRDRK